jgi:hypothetical protein
MPRESLGACHFIGSQRGKTEGAGRSSRRKKTHMKLLTFFLRKKGKGK